jgi:hypothetical protein
MNAFAERSENALPTRAFMARPCLLARRHSVSTSSTTSHRCPQTATRVPARTQALLSRDRDFAGAVDEPAAVFAIFCPPL